METITILPKRDANYKIPILFLTGLIWDLNLSLMKKYLTFIFFINNFFKLKKSIDTQAKMHARVYIYIYIYMSLGHPLKPLLQKMIIHIVPMIKLFLGMTQLQLHS